MKVPTEVLIQHEKNKQKQLEDQPRLYIEKPLPKKQKKHQPSIDEGGVLIINIDGEEPSEESDCVILQM